MWVSVLVLAVAAYVTADVLDLAPGWLTRAAPTPVAGPVAAPGGAPGPAPAVLLPHPVDPAALPLPVADTTAPAPTTRGLADTLEPLLLDSALGPSVGIEVRDGVSGARLFSQDAATPRVPASVAKLLTAFALATAADLHTAAQTRVVAGDAPDRIVLVAGGDTLLAAGKGSPSAVAGRAGIADLAAQVAAALKASGVTRVRLGLDTTLAAGPAYAPGWPAADVRAGYTGPVAMIGLATDRPLPGRPASSDPAGRVAGAFVVALRAHGIQVTGPVSRTPAPPQARQLGSVQAAPTGEVLALALAESDNALTESLARRVAAEQGVATGFAEVTRWILQQAAASGVSVAGVTLADASGLSRGTRIPAAAIGDLLAKAARSEDADLREMVARLPVAGLSGTLHDRYQLPATRPAAGLVRAKTGTLTGAGSLAGTVVDAEGRLVVFVVQADQVPATGTSRARVALDRVTAALAACGCR